jgi:hypothetical protein
MRGRGRCHKREVARFSREARMTRSANANVM